MCLINKFGLVCILLALATTVNAQYSTRLQNVKELEVGGAIAGSEAFYVGFYSRYSVPLSQKKNHFKLGVGLTSYFDFKGESVPQAKLKNDVDMRLIPNVYLSYVFQFQRFGLGLEVPIGTSIAITKGTLVNERVGFERTYSNTVFLWHTGMALSTKYNLNEHNKIGLYVFLPSVKDEAWSPPTLGLGWTMKMN